MFVQHLMAVHQVNLFLSKVLRGLETQGVTAKLQRHQIHVIIVMWDNTVCYLTRKQ